MFRRILSGIRALFAAVADALAANEAARAARIPLPDSTAPNLIRKDEYSSLEFEGDHFAGQLADWSKYDGPRTALPDQVAALLLCRQGMGGKRYLNACFADSSEYQQFVSMRTREE